MTDSDDYTITLEGIGGWIVLIAFVIIIGLVAGRILGVRRGFWRATISGVVGLVAGQVLIDAQANGLDVNSIDDLWRLGAGFVGYVLLVTLLMSIVLEVLLRPRQKRRGRRRFPRPISWIKRKAAVSSRLWQIAAVARHNGLTGRRLTSRASLATPAGARALRLTLEECGGMFVKFGQIASTREDLLPATITGELSELRSAVSPLPPEVVREVVESELAAPIGSAFASFDLEPLAAASIGVTHRAVLPDGNPVIVKVQRPDVARIVERDARVLRWSVDQVARRSEGFRDIGIKDLADELVDGIIEELDFNREAANNAAMRRTHAPVEGVSFPIVHGDLTTRRLLVMDEVHGRPVSDLDAVRATGVAPEVLADRLFRSFLGQVLTDGVYHADPHPGNILIDTDGVLWFIDYGAVGTIDPVTLDGLQQMALGFMFSDPAMLARALRRLAGPNGDLLDMRAVEFDLSSVLTAVKGGGFDPAAIRLVIGVLSRHGVPAPRALTVLGRAVLTLDGTLRLMFAPFRMGERATDLLRSTTGADQDTMQEMLKHEFIRSLPSLRALPALTEDLALAARAGQLSLRTERYAGDDKEVVDNWVDRVVFAAIGAAGLLGSSALLIASGMIADEDGGAALRLIGFSGLVVSTAMQMRVVAQSLRRRSPT